VVLVGIESISAVTLAVRNMEHSVRFYEDVGFHLHHGGENTSFASFRVGTGFLNLILSSHSKFVWWGRTIFWVTDVDEVYRRLTELGLKPEAEPRDAEWGERYFHIRDPDGHELSFAKALSWVSGLWDRALTQ
jgi:catechol 2,3-dioxygenase-like lactoylglutathione lyase family enzyme